MCEKIRFQPFDENGEGRVYYHGFLPHWRQKGCTYFVTFRLVDSVPKGVLEQWKQERSVWLKHRTGETETSPESIGKLTKADRLQFFRAFSSKLFNELDKAHGHCILREPKLAAIVFNAMTHFHGKRVECGDIVVMPNHVHALLTPLGEHELEDVLHSVKSFSAHEINAVRNESGAVWMKESHDHIVRDAEELLRIQNYIMANPTKGNVPDGQFLLRTVEYEL